MSYTMKLWEKVVEKRVRHMSLIIDNQIGLVPQKFITEVIFLLR